MDLYFAVILDYNGNVVLRLEYTCTAKHSAFLGKQYVDNCANAGSWKINKTTIDKTLIKNMMNAS
jgi:hypothetical protein